MFFKNRYLNFKACLKKRSFREVKQSIDKEDKKFVNDNFLSIIVVRKGVIYQLFRCYISFYKTKTNI